MFREPVDLSEFKPKYPAPPRMRWFVMLAPFLVIVIWQVFLLFTSDRGDVQAMAMMKIWLPLLARVIYSAFVLMQILWFRKVNPKSLAYPLYLVYITFSLILPIVQVVLPGRGIADDLATIAVALLGTCTNFVFRGELQHHYNEVEPIGIYLNGAMTFFFARYYFQYHFRKIALLKDEAAAMQALPTA